MSTYDERWYQAHRYAQSCADSAYRLGGTLDEKATLYFGVYTREMHAFKQLEAMRKPLPNQAEIYARSAEVLGLNRCPECDTPITTGTRCVHCQGE